MRYYVGYVFSGAVEDYYNSITADLAQRFGIKNLAATQAAHLTFKAPFESDNVEVFEKELTEVASHQKSIRFEIDGFGRFDLESKTIFLAIKPNPELQKQAEGIVAAVSNFGENRLLLPDPVYLHVSIARDLTPELSEKILGYLETLPKPHFEIVFDRISLLVKENDFYKVKSVFPFSQ